MTRSRHETHEFARQIKRQTVPVRLRWMPAMLFPHVRVAVSKAISEGRLADRHPHRFSPPTRGPWTMPFDLDNWLDDHSYSGEHKLT